MIQWLSDEDLLEQMKAQGVEDATGSCSYRSMSEPMPCGGCEDCISAQISYYFHEERKRVAGLQAAGFEVSNPALVQLDWMPGMSAGHSSYDCWMSGERGEPNNTNAFFPWERAL